MTRKISYIDFFPRHSYGEVPLLVYNDLELDKSDNAIYILKDDKNLKCQKKIKAFLIPDRHWDRILEGTIWHDIDEMKPTIAIGSFVSGELKKEKNDFIIKTDAILSGTYIFSDAWEEAGIRHVDFVERAVPIQEDFSGFNDYTRRWRERELKDQGFMKSEMNPESYNDQFMRINGPIRYHFFLSEDAGKEPDCYYHNNKIFMPAGCPVFEDLLTEGFENSRKNEFWGPVWVDPEYPYENFLWMWITERDMRKKCQIALRNRCGDLSLLLVPFYFSFIL
ncbi:hypothetical protein KKB99_00255 [bacterium]|nr:hypothetical protein [bacterium]MBU1024416.1 hypothetical protein [bacterium]